eukprot:TRINITY_DN4074_c1_g3_i4.p1 TRINITY_DN4074_c1_g3~~TRINITY_DN4074_c1_g3_i4.p1  ORF type:complete len:162 (-),score=10.39 TRINITY_DN4074_c1_g3_i4:60-545(-)
MSDPTDALPFPRFPPFPPQWESRSGYIHWWLIMFMSAVGLLKAAGFLRHDLSQIVGVLEFTGGIVFLPRWGAVSGALGKGGSERSVRLGAWLILSALGMIVSTYKRKSPVCWSQAFLTLELLRSRGGNPLVVSGIVALVVGTIGGLLLQKFLLGGIKVHLP